MRVVIVVLLAVIAAGVVASVVQSEGRQGRCEQRNSETLLHGDPANPPVLPSC